MNVSEAKRCRGEKVEEESSEAGRKKGKEGKRKAKERKEGIGTRILCLRSERIWSSTHFKTT